VEDDDGVVTVGASPTTTNSAGGVSADDSGSVVAPDTRPGLAKLPFAAVIADRGGYVNSKRCTRTQIHLQLTRKGLPGPAIRFGTTARCPVGGRIILRLRFTYVPGPAPAHYVTGGRVRSAFLVVRTFRTQKPLAFARLTANGQTSQLYSAASCTT
jgi:hypothetical protein